MTLPGAGPESGDELARMRAKRAARTGDDQPLEASEDEIRALLEWCLAAIEESGGDFDVRGGLLARGAGPRTAEAIVARLGASDTRHPSNERAATEAAAARSAAVDDKVLELRGQGRSFRKIAEVLGFDRPRGPIEAFNRALRRRPREQQEVLLAEELDRLDTMERRVRADPALSRPELDRRLRTVSRIRGMVSAR